MELISLLLEEENFISDSITYWICGLTLFNISVKDSNISCTCSPLESENPP